MLKILNHGDDKYDIEDSSGTKIGWISGRSIGFRGFATESDAREGAVVAWRALDRVVRQHCAGEPRHEPAVDRIQTVHDGAYEWLHDGTAPIARLLRPQWRAYDGSFGIELVIPVRAVDGVATAAARCIAAATAPYREEVASSPRTNNSTTGANASFERVESASGASSMKTLNHSGRE